MSAQLAPPIFFQAFATNNTFLVGGLLNTYAAGTSSPQATYTDSTQATTNPNPIVLDAYGSCELWLNPNLTYKFVLTDPLGNVLKTVDQVGSYLTAAGLSSLLSGYVTNTQLATDLASYVTTAALTATLAGYVTTGSLSGYAPLASPAFTGVPTAPTASSGTNTTQLATTAFVISSVSGSNVSLNTNGYQIGTNGLIIQWGVTPGSGGSPVTVTFPTAFLNAVFSVTACSVNSNQTINWDKTSTTLTSLAFNVGATSVALAWMAFGY